MPLVGVRSLIDTGTPCSAPSVAPRFPTAAVALRAAANACSAATVQYALSAGLIFSILATTTRTTSNGDTFRRLISETNSDACAKHSSTSFMECPCSWIVLTYRAAGWPGALGGVWDPFPSRMTARPRPGGVQPRPIRIGLPPRGRQTPPQGPRPSGSAIRRGQLAREDFARIERVP